MRHTYLTIIFLIVLAVTGFIIACESDTDNFVARDLAIVPSEANPGETVAIEFFVDINYHPGVKTTWTLTIDGEKVQEKEISHESGETTRVVFNTEAGESGNHTVFVYAGGGADNLTGSFYVRDVSSSTN